jgi:hypothetical protein
MSIMTGTSLVKASRSMGLKSSAVFSLIADCSEALSDLDEIGIRKLDSVGCAEFLHGLPFDQVVAVVGEDVMREGGIWLSPLPISSRFLRRRSRVYLSFQFATL